MICQFFNRELILWVDVIVLFRHIIPNDKIIFVQVMSLVPTYELRRCIDKYKRGHKTQRLTCRDQFMVMSYAQFTRSTSLRVTKAPF